ncbi:MAG: DUF6033 family protein [Lachnospiraceae bacterium]|nr:DUF6033 family protein [Lachnospiraceae bacterium]
MSLISQATAAYANSAAYTNNALAAKKPEESGASGAASAVSETKTAKSTGNYGKTIGKPELSEKAAAYYEDLKKKFGDMDFVLVSRDMKEAAKQQAGTFANPNRMVVLIDEDKIEKMAEDESFRNQYEGIISQAKSGLSRLKTQTANNSNVKGYGMQVNDGGTASFFAVLKDSSKAQKARIEKKAAEKKEAEKAAEKKEAAKKAEEKAAEKAEEKAQGAEAAQPDWDETGITLNEGDVILSASSVDELLKKIEAYEFDRRADSVMTEEEKAIGGNIDFRG